jgi:hypothetical protein
MVTFPHLDHLIPLGAVFPVSLLLVLLSVALGFWIGTQHRTIPETPIGSVVGAMLGLLAFMLAFTFGMSASRFEARRQLLLDDVNAIQTAVRRSELLPEPQRSESRALLRRYVDLRVEVARDPSRIRAAVVETDALQQRLWSGAIALARQDTHSDIGALYAESLNALMNAHTSRTTVALLHQIPETIWYVLILLTMMCMVAVGFQFGISGRASIVVILWLAVAFSAVVTLIAHLDRPIDSALRVSQQPMLDLVRDLRNP